MKRVLIVLVLIFANACATVPHRGSSIRVSNSDYIDIASFCKKHSFEYSFDTIDDLIRV